MGSSSSSWLATLRFTSDEELPIHTLTGLEIVGSRLGGVRGAVCGRAVHEVLFVRSKAQRSELPSGD